ncbi:Oxidoreductase [Cladophialophora chaetospira]|uniref:Mitochondrial intermembrane space import and assembly protein 40 n=1 Tax=Cladophialophora chaetospira TaxID=386627 RepID=A0AA39CCF4_9EURO|nr:Oxidoreductase [Cladophialophora chaetospira]
MFRPVARSALRSAARLSPALSPVTSTLGKRFASTSPANARRSWKSSAVRWGAAIAGLYYYNTSPVFAEQPQHNLLNPNLDAFDDEHRDHSSLEALTSGRARQAERNASVLHSAVDTISSENASTTEIAEHEKPLNTGAAELEEEAAGEGAFNPETGEINWDCPCLGGMAHGPCGPEFREAFSCFVFSTEEPKGMDCIDKFQNMQGCFQKYPEVYKGELEDDEELSAGLEDERQELVNEIAERKKQQSETGSQRRLLEEPDSTSQPTRAPKKASSQKSQEQPQPQLEGRKEAQESATRTQPQSEGGKEAQKSAPRTQPQPESLPSPATNATDANSENKKPLEEAKAKVSNDPSHESTFSPERENIHEGQKSGVTKDPQHSSRASFVPESEIVPKAAHDASNASTSDASNEGKKA